MANCYLQVTTDNSGVAGHTIPSRHLVVESRSDMALSPKVSMDQSEIRDTTPTTNPATRPINTDLAATMLAVFGAEASAEDPNRPAAAEALVADAVRERATDIHLDPRDAGLCVRMRIDRVMHDAARLGPRQQGLLVNQFKTLAGIDPVAQFSADEARFSFTHQDREIDLRLAIVPTLEGEKVTLRLLDPMRIVSQIDQLGLSEEDLARIQQWFVGLGGIFMVVGPVGSGKTTTLYSLLHNLKLKQCSVSTLEDPVEYSVEGINQVEIDEDHGLSFASGVAGLARHDPDVILVGELRDAATAEAAYGAAALGRTILTTAHGRDAAGAVTSLRYHGLSDRDIATTLSVVISQRLVRKLCPHCRRETSPTDQQKRWCESAGLAVPDLIWEPGQCEQCRQSGYHGQTGVFEVWRLVEDDYHLLLEGATERDIRDSLASRGQRSFLADALEKVGSGTTTVAEVRRLNFAGPSFVTRPAEP